MNFAIQSEFRKSKDSIPIMTCHALNRNVSYKVVTRPQEVPKDHVPVGSVEWVEKVLGKQSEPDYYPEFLKDWLHRKVWRQDNWPNSNVFVKPADRHKRFTGFVTDLGRHKNKRGPFWCSDVVYFRTEWRYYVANGEVLTKQFCCGEEEEPPELDIDWRNHFGAVDFGRLTNGKIALVENNGPYACGWYGPLHGKEAEAYVNWLYRSWNHLTSNNIAVV